MSWLSGITNIGKKILGSNLGGTLVKTAILGYLINRLRRNALKDNAPKNENIDGGVRLQIPPASDNKIPVLYGTAVMSGIITDAEMSNNNKRMTYCLTISEKTGTLMSTGAASAYLFKQVYWNDQRIIFKADGFTVDYTVDREGNQDLSLRDLVKVYCYAGNASTTSIPENYTNASYPAAYTVMPGWALSTHIMTNLIFVIVEVNYNREKNVTGIGDMRFQIQNSMNKPGDVMRDYLTNTVYGAGIDVAEVYTS